MSESATLYTEEEQTGNSYRAVYLAETLKFIKQEKKRAAAVRARWFAPDYSSENAYAASMTEYRKTLSSMLGLDYFERFPRPGAPAEISPVAEDALSRIFRVRIPVLPGLFLYGLLFRIGEEKRPLVIVQHGGQGTPELCAGFFGSENYHDIVRRFLRKGVHVFAPQLMLYNTTRFGPKFDRPVMDVTLRQLGTSVTALHVFEIIRAIDWLETQPYVLEKQIGMAGLSYGGLYTMLTTAMDFRVHAAYIAGIFNDRIRYNDRVDMTMQGQADKLTDAEIAGMICPRPLFIEAGRSDDLFAFDTAEREAGRAARWYGRLGLESRFCFRAFDGTHEFGPDDAGIDFILRFLSR